MNSIKHMCLVKFDQQAMGKKRQWYWSAIPAKGLAHTESRDLKHLLIIQS